MVRRSRSIAARVQRSNQGPSWRQRLHSTSSRDFSRQSLEEYLSSVSTSARFGDNPDRRLVGSTRVLFQNVQGLPQSPGHEKHDKLKKWIRKDDIDIVLLAELNLFWPAVTLGHHWRDRVRSLATNGFSSDSAWNTQEERSGHSSVQAGGTALAFLGSVSHGARASGHDPSGLGRWVWARIEGKARRHVHDDESGDQLSRTQDLIVIAAYRPCRPGKGSSTVWAQQRLFFASKGISQDPRELFVTDLLKEISKWQKLGYEMILGLDANEDLRKTDTTSLRHRLFEHGLSGRCPSSTEWLLRLWGTLSV